MLTSDDGCRSKCPSYFQINTMKPIRHLISIVLLVCGLTAWGGERGYDQNDTLKTHELDKYVMKEMEILDKDSLFWGHHLQEGYEKRVVLQRNDISDPSRRRKGKNEVWKDLIEQVVRDVVG